MHPAAARLAADHHLVALAIARNPKVNFRDKQIAADVALEACCVAAELWVAQGQDGDGFRGWMVNFIRWRIVDEWRNLYGRHATAARRADFRRHTSLDQLADGFERQVTVADTIPDPAVQVEDGIIDALHDRWVYDRIVAKLTDRELRVVELLGGGATLAEVGATLGVSESRVCQIRRKLHDRFARLAAA